MVIIMIRKTCYPKNSQNNKCIANKKEINKNIAWKHIRKMAYTSYVSTKRDLIRISRFNAT